MPDAFADYMSGVPNVRAGTTASMFETNPMSLRSREHLSTSRLAAKSALLETQDRMERFREQERARVEGRRAMETLTRLNPLNPDYEVQVRDVIAKNPAAMMDETVNGFLGVQGDIFDREQRTRDIEDQRSYQKTLEDENRQYRDFERGKDKRERKRDDFDRRLETLPLDQRGKVQGGNLKEKKASLDSVTDEAKEREQVLSLYEVGYTKPEIDALRGENGRIDPEKRAMALGVTNRKKIDRDLTEEQEAAKGKKIALLTSALKDKDLTDSERLELSAERAELLGITAPAQPGSPAKKSADSYYSTPDGK